MNSIKSLVKRVPGDFWLMVLVSVLLTIVASLYLALIGIPKTQAKNLTNQGIRMYQQGDLSGAKQKFEQAQQIWQTNESEQYLELVTK